MKGHKTEFKNVYEYKSPRQERDNLPGDFRIHIRRGGKLIIAKSGFKTADEARKAGDLALIKAGLPQINGSFRLVNKSLKKHTVEGFN